MNLKNKKVIALIALIATISSPMYSATTKKNNTVKENVIENKKVKNVILLIPDGQSMGGLTLARWYNGGAPLAVDEITSGLVRTYNADTPIADSAPAGTAMATGYKTNTKYVGVMPSVTGMYNVPSISDENKQKPMASILEAAKLSGKSTGIVATSNIQHATPADFTSHFPDRNQYEILGEQQVYNRIDVALGAGYKYLLGENRKDKEDLISELKTMGYDVVRTDEEMKKSKSTKIYGLFADDALAYEMDRETNRSSEPSLQEMTEKAISTLSQDKDGFFLMVEGSKVDWAAHANDPIAIISDILAFDKAVKTALDFAKKDGNTVVIVATDHGNGGITIGNKDTSSNYDKVPLSTFIDPLKKAKLTGEGIEEKFNTDKSNIKEVMSEYYGINDLTNEEVEAIKNTKKGSMNYTVGPMISKRAYIGWTTNGHTGEDIPLHVYHPKNMELKGTVQNTDIAKYMATVLGLDLDKTTDLLYNNVINTLSNKKITYTWKNDDFVNPELLIETNGKKISIPAYKDYYFVNGKKVQSKGVNVFINKDKFFVSKDILNLL